MAYYNFETVNESLKDHILDECGKIIHKQIITMFENIESELHIEYDVIIRSKSSISKIGKLGIEAERCANESLRIQETTQLIVLKYVQERMERHLKAKTLFTIDDLCRTTGSLIYNYAYEKFKTILTEYSQLYRQLIDEHEIIRQRIESEVVATPIIEVVTEKPKSKQELKKEQTRNANKAKAEEKKRKAEFERQAAIAYAYKQEQQKKKAKLIAIKKQKAFLSMANSN